MLRLVVHVTKVLTSIMSNRIEQKIEEVLTEDQSEFRRGRGTHEAILALRAVVKKIIEKAKQHELHLLM